MQYETSRANQSYRPNREDLEMSKYAKIAQRIQDQKQARDKKPADPTPEVVAKIEAEVEEVLEAETEEDGE